MRLLSAIAVRPAAISFRWFSKAFKMYTQEALERAITSCCDVNMEPARQHLQRVSTVHGHCHATWLIGVALGSVEALSTSSVAFPPNEVAPPGKAIMKCASIITAPPLTCPRRRLHVHASHQCPFWPGLGPDRPLRFPESTIPGPACFVFLSGISKAGLHGE